MLVLPPILAQETPETLKTITGIAFLDSILAPIGGSLGSSILNFLFAIIVLVVGWIVAGIVKSIVKGLLGRTNIDNKVAGWISGREGGESIPIEKWISEVVYWVIILFVVVAFLQTLQLEAVSEPLNALLEQITSFLPKIGGALILLALAWLLATLVKMIVGRALRAFRVDERLGQQVGETTTTTSTTPSTTTTGTIPPRTTGTDPSATTTTTNQFSLSETIANTLYWFIFLLFLPSILSTLELEGTLSPVQGLVDKILSILPNILAAVLIGFVGWTIAQIVRKVVTNLLAATGTDRVGARFGLSTATGGKSLSWIIGTVVYVLILIPVAIAALQALKIEAISEPAIAMLNDILTVLPQIFTAAVILIFAYVAAKYLADLVTSILTGIGFNNVSRWLGLSFVTTPRTRTTTPPPGMGETTAIQTTIPSKTPSELVGIVVLVGIMLVATLTAVDILNIPALTNLVGAIVLIAGQVLTGIIIFAIGLFLANLAFNLITSSGSRQSRILAQTARIAIIALVSAMALQQMGIASSIVNLAFGLLLGAIAIAIALAFGLGSRDIAAEQVREWLDSFKRD
ncbi:MAG: mechanosensitive ion channel [Spirulinaceae cyanobacterium]